MKWKLTVKANWIRASKRASKPSNIGATSYFDLPVEQRDFCLEVRATNCQAVLNRKPVAAM
ncbi:hypothetical protein GCM10010833_13260 [Blastomonas aquatica]|uniref:Uncharacterized protein n=1 Tax=Blastomonas aquatica TaxID=1510276 RepID=A0ABQ1J4L5_9SPHN|nr:hypothetical protein GCM10010833_13260 [Blastomonas aquatica]